MPHVAAIAKLAHVFPRMFRRDMDVRPGNGPLHQRPMTFQRVHVMDAANILFLRMVDRLMRVGMLETAIGAMFVSADR